LVGAEEHSSKFLLTDKSIFNNDNFVGCYKFKKDVYAKFKWGEKFKWCMLDDFKNNMDLIKTFTEIGTVRESLLTLNIREIMNR